MKMPVKQLFLCAFFFIVFPFFVAAQVIVTDRPGQNDSPVSIPKGSFQLETGISIAIDEQASNWMVNGSLFKYGLLDNFELRLLTGLAHTKSRPVGEINTIGISDLMFGVKYQFLNGRSTTGGYLGHLILPSGTKEVSRGAFGMNHHIAMSHQLADWFSITWNAGAEYFVDEDPNGLFALSFGFGLTDQVGFFTEVYGNWDQFDSIDLFYDHGLTFLVRDDLQLDFSMGTGINSKSNFYAVGVSWRAPFQS